MGESYADRHPKFARWLHEYIAEMKALRDSLPKPDPEFERQRAYRERKKRDGSVQ